MVANMGDLTPGQFRAGIIASILTLGGYGIYSFLAYNIFSCITNNWCRYCIAEEKYKYKTKKAQVKAEKAKCEKE